LPAKDADVVDLAVSPEVAYRRSMVIPGTYKSLDWAVAMGVDEQPTALVFHNSMAAANAFDHYDDP
jgi:hypothetical protein